MPLSFTQDQLALINLLLRLAVMAGIISLLTGFRSIADYLARVNVTRPVRLRLFVIMALFFVLGVVVRKLSNQAAMDLSLEGALVAGFIGGAWIGAGTGFVIGLACYIFGEKLGLPFYTLAGFLAGILYSGLGRRGEIWNFSLNPFLIIYNFLERLFKRSLDRNIIPFVLCIGFALIRYELLDRFYARGLLYGYPVRDWLFITIDMIVLVYTVGIALKMANNVRTEIIVREEEAQLIHARLTTLKSQVNPHFLFNTLNSISALIRTDAEKAREMTRKLSSIFRKSLEDSSDTHSLEEEFDFLDDYLSIEKIRFGEDRLKVVKELDPDSRGFQLPSMLLQPVVENAIKHGISCIRDGGTVRISAGRSGRGVMIEVSNDGPEAGEFDLSELLCRGMGLRNVFERLRIYSRGDGKLELKPRPGGGALVTIFIPEIRERRMPIADQGVDCR